MKLKNRTKNKEKKKIIQFLIEYYSYGVLFRIEINRNKYVFDEFEMN